MRKPANITPRVRHGRNLASTHERIVRPIYMAPRKDGDWR